MDAEEKLRFCTFQASRVAGIGVAVTGMRGIYLAGRTAFTGAYFGGKALVQSLGRLTLPVIGKTSLSEAEQGIRILQETASIKSLPTSTVWPPHRGFSSGIIKRKFLPPGEIIDRYGSSWGRFTSPHGTPLPARSMRINNLNSVNAGFVEPWYGQPGMGVQYEMPVPIEILLKKGFLESYKP